MSNNTIQLLDRNWEFQGEGQEKWYEANVPGCVHQDLFDNKLIEDPFFRLNESKYQWIMDKKWTYKSLFNSENDILERKNKRLVFKGLDTYADIYLNKSKILSSNNMFHAWEVDVTGLLKSELNELKIVFHSPIKTVQPFMNENSYQLPADNDQAGDTSPYTRKAPYHYGWDWGPCFVTSGIWKNIELHGWDYWYIDRSAILNNNANKQSADLHLEIEVFSEINENASLKISDPKSNTNQKIPIKITKGKNLFQHDFSIDEPDLWWPIGHGEQPIYSFSINIDSDSHSKTISKRIGIRDVLIKRESDKKGKSFEIHINSKPIFSKGANWIPADSFVTRLAENDYRKLLTTAVEANMNTLRIWGGGIYEPDCFYDLCDELGILIWQDFMFACSMYPAHKEFLDSVEREAQYQVNRIKSHPSVILWCGNNEIASGWLSWGWKEELPSSVWDDYNTLFHKLLPSVCEKLDPYRLYWPSSPGHSIDLPDEDQLYGSGDNHYWGVWHGGDDFSAFEDNVGRFLSEYGMQSFPEMKTVMKFALDHDLSIDSEVMKSRQKASLGTGNLVQYIESYFSKPIDFISTVFLSQIMQAFAIKNAVEIHRRNMPFCMGTLYWQLNDCWPAISWSSVDYYGNWKALHYHARRFFNPIIITMHEVEDQIKIHLVNDQHKELESAVKIQLYNLNCNLLKEESFKLKIDKASSNCIKTFDKKSYLHDHKSSDVFLHAEIVSGKKTICQNKYFFVKPKELDLPENIFSYDVNKTNDVTSINIKASSFIYQLHIFCNNANGVFSDNYFDMLAGEEVIIYFTPDEGNGNIEYDFSFNTLKDLIK